MILGRHAGVIGAFALFIAVTSAASAPPPTIDKPDAVRASTAAHDAAPGANPKTATGEPAGAEVASLRSEFSRTYVEAGGTLRTVIRARPINFRDKNGKWAPIDDTLVAAAGGGYTNTASATRVIFPDNLSRPVEVRAADGSAVAFSLNGAAATPANVSTNTASYGGARPGLDVKYSFSGDVVSEILEASSVTATEGLSFSLRLGEGLSAAEGPGGAIEIRRGNDVKFVLAAPYMYDSAPTPARSRDVQFVLHGTPTAPRVSIVPDRAWLTDKARVWPVSIDPTVGVYSDCTLTSGGAAATSFCATPTLDVGTSSGQVSRAITPTWDLSSIPRQEEVLYADLQLTVQSATWTAPVSVSVHQVTRAHTTAATWNTYDGTNAWASPGGDYRSQPDDTQQIPVGTPRSYYWNVTRAAQGWLDGTTPNHGLIARATDETTPDLLRFVSYDSTAAGVPTLVIHHMPRIGNQRQFENQGEDLTARLDYAINVANGNLVLHADDLETDGTGVDANIDRYFNNLSPLTWYVGNGWVLGTGQDVRLDQYGDGSVGVFGESGGVQTFRRNADSSYTAPTATDATLVKRADGNCQLTYNESDLKFVFAGCNGTATSEVDRNGNTLTFHYGANIADVTDTRGRKLTFAYNAQGLVSSITDAAGRSASYTYDANKNMIASTDIGGGTTTYTYDAGYNLTSVTTPAGRTTRFYYDALARVTSAIRVTDPASGTGPTTTYSYGTGTTTVTDPNGHPTTYLYDNQLRVTRIVDALGHATDAALSGNSDESTITDSLGKQTTNGYDARNNPTSNREPTGATATSSFDLSGPHPYLAAMTTDGQGIRSNFSYDGPGNLLSQSEGASGINPVRFTYNPNGTVATATNAKGATITNTYDVEGRVTQVAYPGGLRGAVSFTYDALGRTKTVRDGKGQLTTYAYDSLDRITNVAYADGTTISYSYDADDNVKTRSDATGTTTFSYDAVGQLVQEVTPTATISYSYDAAGNLASVRDLGGTTTYTYDAADNVAAATDPTGAQTTFAYDSEDRRTATNFPNGVTLTVVYDDSGRTVSIVAKKLASGSVLSGRSYTYGTTSGDSDLISSVTDAVSGTTTTYGYDGRGRLTSAAGGGTSYSYTYDGNGNRASATVNGATTSYTYNAVDELTAAGAGTYGYDLNGNLTSGASGTFTYNAKNQTSSIAVGGATATNMTYAGQDQSERASAGSTQFANGRLGVHSLSSGAGSTYYTYDPDGTLLSVRNPGSTTGTFYYVPDAIDSVIAITDATGTVAATYKYDPFGKDAGSTGTIVNPWRFAGGYYTTTLKLYKFGLRYYDPATGRWTQSDSVTDPLETHGWNAYAYAGNDPINITDPSGECFPACALPLLAVPGLGEVVGAAIVVTTVAVGAASIYETVKSAKEHRKKGTTNPANRPRHQKGTARKERDAARAAKNKPKGQQGGKGKRAKKTKKKGKKGKKS